MIFEKIGIFIIQAKELAANFYTVAGQEIGSQLVQTVLSGILMFLTVLLFWVWSASDLNYPLEMKIVFTGIYLLCVVVYSTGLYFFLSKRQVKKIDGQWEIVEIPPKFEKRINFEDLQPVITSEEQIDMLYQKFSKRHLTGSLKNFQKLLHLKPLEAAERLKWTDPIPKNPKQLNRQTLLEFLSQIFSGFENLDNQGMINFVSYYFCLDHAKGSEHFITSKIISDWRLNQSPYLKDISNLIDQAIKG